MNTPGSSLPYSIPAKNRFLLFFCGISMTCSEIWKQFTLTYIIGSSTYDWWYFPFQLCSIPMYILLVLPWIKNNRICRLLLVFLMTFSLLGGIAVFADTSGLHYPIVPLTVHSYSWHVLLILIGLYAGSVFFRTYPDHTVLPSFAGSTALYLICCGIAELLNLTLGRYGPVNLFYINPNYPMQQIVFRQLAPIAGNLSAILVYIFSTIAGAFLLLLLWRFFLIRLCCRLRRTG